MKNVCVCLGAREPTSYQENGAKETEAGDRKLEEEAAPIVRAQHGSYGNHSQGGKTAETDSWRWPHVPLKLPLVWAWLQTYLKEKINILIVQHEEVCLWPHL